MGDRERQHKFSMMQFEEVCHGTNCNASKAMPRHSAECRAEHDACFSPVHDGFFSPVAWMRPSEEGYDSAFRDQSTVVQCTGNDWAGWVPLYTKEMLENAVLAEREACALACNPRQYPNEADRNIAHKCAAAIRAQASNVEFSGPRKGS